MSGRKNTDEQVAERLAAVEAVMLAGEYNRASANGLAQRYAVSLRQIQRDAARVREHWQDTVAGSTEAGERSDWLMRVRGAQARSFRNGHSMAAARLLQLEGQALGVYEPARVQVSHVHSEDPQVLLNELREALPLITSMIGPNNGAIEAQYLEVKDGQEEETNDDSA